MMFFVSLICGFFFFNSVSLGAGFIDNQNGVPYKWKQSTETIPYKVDIGKLGNYTNDQAQEIVANSFQAWANIPIGSGVVFSYGGPILVDGVPKDVDSSNYNKFITLTQNLEFRTLVEDSIIIFDDDGLIIEDFWGTGASEEILGFASPGLLDEANHQILSGFSVINGSLNVSQVFLQSVMTHEFGHLFNLAHSQINSEEAFNGNSSDDSVIPTMFPVLPSDVQVFTSLEKDDEFSFGYLYPSTQFLEKGRIQGKILRRKGDGVRAVEVICRNLSNPRKNVVSWFSDQVFQNEGEYLCGNLSSGSYSIEIQPILQAINLFTPYPPYIASEFFSGASESFDPLIDSRTSSEPVSVVEGAATPNIDVILNEDGRLISGKTILGTSQVRIVGTQMFEFSDLEYFITVPKNASSVRFEVNATDFNNDFDIYGRCDSEFSLSLDTVPILYTTSPTTPKQAEFAGIASGNSEILELSGSSSPSIQPCTYHLLIIPSGGNSYPSQFELTATIRSDTPVLTVHKETANTSSQGSGDLFVAHQRIEAQGDTFRIRSLSFVDLGDGNLDSVVEAKLYIDEGDGGPYRFISSASKIDPSTREIIFSNFDEFVEDSTIQNWYVLYSVSSASSMKFWLGLIILLGLGIGKFCPKQSLFFLGLILGFSLMTGTCSNEEPLIGFHPLIENRQAVSVEGLSFGDQIQVDIDREYKSVKDFFD